MKRHRNFQASKMLTIQDCFLSSVSKLEWRIDTRTIDIADRIAEMKVKNDTTGACFSLPEGTSHTIPPPKDLAVLTVDLKMQISVWDFPFTLHRVNRSGRKNSILEYPRSPRGYKQKISYN